MLALWISFRFVNFWSQSSISFNNECAIRIFLQIHQYNLPLKYIICVVWKLSPDLFLWLFNSKGKKQWYFKFKREILWISHTFFNAYWWEQTFTVFDIYFILFLSNIYNDELPKDRLLTLSCTKGTRIRILVQKNLFMAINNILLSNVFCTNFIGLLAKYYYKHCFNIDKSNMELFFRISFKIYLIFNWDSIYEFFDYKSWKYFNQTIWIIINYLKITLY